MQVCAEMGDRIFRPKAREDDSGDQRQMEVGVGVARQPFCSRPSAASASRRPETSATTSK